MLLHCILAANSETDKSRAHFNSVKRFRQKQAALLGVKSKHPLLEIPESSLLTVEPVCGSALRHSERLSYPFSSTDYMRLISQSDPRKFDVKTTCG